MEFALFPCLKKITWKLSAHNFICFVIGSLHVYLARLPMLASLHQTRIAHLTSLLEVTIEDHVNGVRKHFLFYSSFRRAELQLACINNLLRKTLL
jgi:hypothetical protein